jgi:cell division transport system permease protein
MQPKANLQEIHAVQTQLSQLTYVRQSCAFWDKQRNFNEARKLLSSDVLGATSVAGMPTSFWCTPTALSDAALVVSTFHGSPGVLTVTEPSQQIHTEQTVINVFKWVFLGVAVILIVSAAVLILNSIRMAIFARRREVSVMKLVGATNWFIRVPFMSEGLIQGFFGSALAALSVYGLYAVVNHFGGGTGNSNVLSSLHLSLGDMILTNVVVVIVGMAIGSLGSGVAIRRFLDV